MQTFLEKSGGFTGVIGVIDATHIAIKQPTHKAIDYYNRNKYHSVILQGVCDHNGMFIDIFVGLPGKLHDAQVFKRSPLYNRLISANNPMLQPDEHIIADLAYPLMTNVMVPCRDTGHLNDQQKNYNEQLGNLRSIIERSFGRLKGKFQRLKYLDISDPNTSLKIITAACILHNIILKHEGNEDEPTYVLDNEVAHQEYEGTNKESCLIAEEKRNDIVMSL